MKIFGKRSDRKTPPSPTTSSSNNDNDEIVRALLREDRPTTWNAKQRRLVKRYRDRIRQDGDTAANLVVERESAAVAADEAVSVVPIQPVHSGADQVLAGHLAEDEDDGEEAESESSESDTQEERDSVGQEDISEIEVKSNQVGARKPSDVTESGLDEETDAKDSLSYQANNGHSVKNKLEGAKEDHSDNPDNAQQKQPCDHEASGPACCTIDEELQAMLDKLNSKQRRKLVRSLERKEMDVETVRSEAKSLLGLDIGEKKTTSEVAESPRKKRKRGNNNNTDVSQIPTEERLRREEQRRLQKDAMEARGNGGGTGGNKHKHPLNSERRRANRRKPKWETRRPATNEHNSSGFHMRKITSTES